MSVTMEEKAARWIVMARLMNEIDTAGGLHHVVEDGNVLNSDLYWAIESGRLTPAEYAFTVKLLDEFTEDERAAIYELTAGAV